MHQHYGPATNDYLPFAMSINIENLPAISNDVNNLNAENLNWSAATGDDILIYALLWRDINCN